MGEGHEALGGDFGGLVVRVVGGRGEGGVECGVWGEEQGIEVDETGD